MTKRVSPFATVARPQKYQPNHVFVICGPGSWELARQYNKFNYPALVCPDNESPDSFKWPVFKMDITVLDYGFSDDQLQALAYSLLKAGALLVAVVADADGRGQVSTYVTEALTNAA